MKTKIAVTYENGEVFQHFGHTKEFKFYTVEDKKIVDSEIVPTMGSGHSMLADFLLLNGVTVLICGGIGGGAKAALAQKEHHHDHDHENCSEHDHHCGGHCH